MMVGCVVKVFYGYMFIMYGEKVCDRKLSSVGILVWELLNCLVDGKKDVVSKFIE